MATKTTRTAPISKAATDPAITKGYRSGLEDKIAAQLRAAGVIGVYETVRIGYTWPATRSRYTPDFPLPNGIVVETKGRFTTEDRQKHKLIKEQHPDIDIRFVFSRALSKLSKGSKTTYAMWCEKYGFKYAEGRIPQEWLLEPVNKRSLEALAKATG